MKQRHVEIFSLLLRKVTPNPCVLEFLEIQKFWIASDAIKINDMVLTTLSYRRPSGVPDLFHQFFFLLSGN